MPAALTALFAVAIHGAKRSQADSSELQRAAAMLVTAAGDGKLVWSISDGLLLLNGIPIPPDSPGADLTAEAMAIHGAAELHLPAAMTTEQWCELSAIFAAAPGIYPTSGHVRAAVTGVVQGATFEATPVGVIDDESEVEEAQWDAVDTAKFIDEISTTDSTLVSREADRADLSDLLEPLLEAGREAVQKRDWPTLAEALLGMQALADRADDATRSIINQERRRVVPVLAVETLVRLLPKTGKDSAIGMALARLGTEGADAILDVLAEDPSRTDRRAYIDVLKKIRGVEEPLVRALSSNSPALLRDAAEVLGTLRVAQVVPKLGELLKHSDLDVCTAAWHALESIGSPEAVELLSG